MLEIMLRLCDSTVGTHRGRVLIELPAKGYMYSVSAFTCTFYLSLCYYYWYIISLLFGLISWLMITRETREIYDWERPMAWLWDIDIIARELSVQHVSWPCRSLYYTIARELAVRILILYYSTWVGRTARELAVRIQIFILWHVSYPCRL